MAVDKYTSAYTGEEIDAAIALTNNGTMGNEALNTRVYRVEDSIEAVSAEGFFYTDSAGYIAMQYTPAGGLDAAKVSDHFASLIGDNYNNLTETTYNI